MARAGKSRNAPRRRAGGKRGLGRFGRAARGNEWPGNGGRAEAFTGPSAIELLESHHRQLERLFEEFEKAGEGDKQACFDELADFIAAHAEIEERIFYPVSYADRTEDELRESMEEHLLAKRIIVDCLRSSPEDEQFEAKVSVLKDVLEHHIEEEEGQLFKMVRAGVPRDTLQALGDLMRTAFEELLASGEPRRLVAGEIQAPPSLL